MGPHHGETVDRDRDERRCMAAVDDAEASHVVSMKAGAFRVRSPNPRPEREWRSRGRKECLGRGPLLDADEPVQLERHLKGLLKLGRSDRFTSRNLQRRSRSESR